MSATERIASFRSHIRGKGPLSDSIISLTMDCFRVYLYIIVTNLYVLSLFIACNCSTKIIAVILLTFCIMMYMHVI